MKPVLAVALILILTSSQDGSSEAHEERRREAFYPQPLRDEWTQWLMGEWEGTGDSDTGRGRGRERIERVLNGQFRLHRGEGVITELTPEQIEYLKRNMHASDEEIQRFRREPYQSLEIYTTDQVTGETVAYLFDSLRCMAQGRGRREGDRETIEWTWSNGYKSTRVTERVDRDRMRVIQKTPNMADGSVMEERGEAVRKRPSTSSRPD